jgi:hypothetical protein
MIAEMKPSIWVRHDYISKNRDVTKVIQNLTVEARIILGILWSVSAPEISVMASAISRDTNYTSSLLRVLVNSKELAVLEALRGEFPLEATASLIPHRRQGEVQEMPPEDRDRSLLQVSDRHQNRIACL